MTVPMPDPHVPGEAQLDMPRPLRPALVHSLDAAAIELTNGPVPWEVRRLARHLMEAVDEVLSRPTNGS